MTFDGRLEALNLIRSFVLSGANLFWRNQYDKNTPFDCLIKNNFKLDWMAQDAIINLFSVDSLADILENTKNQDLIKAIINKKVECLKEYYKLYKNRLQYLYFALLERSSTDNSILLLLLDFGANPVLTFVDSSGVRRNGLDFAIKYDLPDIIRYSLSHYVHEISADQLLDIFINAVNVHDDIAHWLSSPLNPKRLNLIQALKGFYCGHLYINLYIQYVLKTSQPDDSFLRDLSLLSYEYSIKEFTLLDYCVQQKKYEWVINILSHNFHKLPIKKILDALQVVQNDEKDHSNQVKVLQLISQIDEEFVLRAIRQAASVMDVMTMVEQVKQHPIMIQYVKLQSDRKIRSKAVEHLMRLAQYADEVIFPNKNAYDQTIMFLQQESRFRLFVNHDKDFIRITKDKIKLVSTAVPPIADTPCRGSYTSHH